MNPNKRNPLSQHEKSRNGFLLLTVVVMIAVASLMLAKLSRDSMRVASASVAQERELRNQWAIISLRRQCLNAAPSLLQDIPDGQPRVLWKDISLGGESWRVILADESAKINVLELAKVSRNDKLKKLIEPLLTGNHPLTLTNDVQQVAQGRPADRAPGSTRSVRWEHWFVGDEGSNLSSRQLATATQQITLWGTGALNVARADKNSVDALWKHLFGRNPPSALHEMRAQSPPPAAAELIGALALRESEAEQATRWITTESRCYSVWAFCQSDRRVPSSLFVECGTGVSAEFRGYEY